MARDYEDSHLDAIVAKLEAQHEALSKDMGDLKSALSSVAESLKTLSGLEQKQLSIYESVARAHKRIDTMEEDLKEDFRGHEDRLRQLEITIAKNAWIERAVTAVVMAVIVVWAKGGL